MLVDSHSIPTCIGGNDNGMLIQITYEKELVELAVTKMANWIHARKLKCSKENSHQNLIWMKPEVNNSKWDDFVFTENDLDVTDEDILMNITEEEEVIEVQMGNAAVSEDNKSRDPGNETAYMLPDELPDLADDVETLWKGFLTKFGYTSFKPFQSEAIKAIQQGHDVIVLQPTGKGKSFCFQVPALVYENKMAVVISPTVSLIQNQVDDLKKRVSAIFR